jgi:hypothetical protein
MTLAVWPQPSMWGIGFERGPWYAVYCWTLHLGPLEARRWAPAPLPYEEQVEARLQRVVRVAASVLLVGFGLALLGAWHAL